MNQQVTTLDLVSFYHNRTKYPENIYKFFDTHEHGDLCPSCLDTHTKIYGEQKYGKSTKIKIEHNLYPKDSNNVLIGEITLCPVCTKKWEILEKIKPVKDVEKIVATWKKRFNSYLDTGLLPADADLYAKNKSEYGSCIFCMKDATGENKGMEIYVPAGQFSELLGHILVCDSCTSEYDKCTNSGFDKMDNVSFDSCHSCQNLYPITDEEQTARVEQNTMGQHLCGKCLEGLNMWDIPQSRMTTEPCSTKQCNTFVTIDHTLDSEEQFYCSSCRGHEKFVFSYESLTIIAYPYPTGKHMMWHYQIMEANGDLITDSSVVCDGYSDAANAVFIATQEAVKHYHENEIGQQLELDEYI